MVPLNLLVWAVETAVSTLVCIVELARWEGLSVEEKGHLGLLYGPYLVLGKLDPGFSTGQV
jgi:hypothetical protein